MNDKLEMQQRVNRQVDLYAEIQGNELSKLADMSIRGHLYILAPHLTYIANGVQIGKETTVHPFVRLYEGANIGFHCKIKAGVHMDGDVVIGEESCIGANVCLEGKIRLGSKCKIEANSVFRGNVTLGDSCIVHAHVVIEGDVEIGDFAEIKPFTYISGNTRIGKNAVIEPHPDIQNCDIGDDAKLGGIQMRRTKTGSGFRAKHHGYLGDAVIGNDVNIGAGAITCNFDGKNKHVTVIKDNAFVGTNVNMVAPVTVGFKAIIAAGSTITGDVPDDSLSIARAPQVNKVGWVLKHRTEEKK